MFDKPACVLDAEMMATNPNYVRRDMTDEDIKVLASWVIGQWKVLEGAMGLPDGPRTEEVIRPLPMAYRGPRMNEEPVLEQTPPLADEEIEEMMTRDQQREEHGREHYDS